MDCDAWGERVHITVQKQAAGVGITVLIGNSTGTSPGVVPFKMLCTDVAAQGATRHGAWSGRP